MNKEKLIEEINNIPKFVLRDVAVAGNYEEVREVDEWVEAENWKAVTEVSNSIPLAFVTKQYSLVQFSEAFIPLLKDIQELEGYCIYYNGFGLIDFFPEDEKLKVNGGDRIGLVAINSVDRTSSVIIKFCVMHKNKIVTIPKRIAGFKRVHIGNAVQITQNFLTVVGKVRDIWKIILTEFEKIKVNETYVTAMMDSVQIKDNYLRKKIIKRVIDNENMDLWDTFLYMIEIIEQRSFKSDVHRRKKLDLISQKMFNYAIASRLINA